MIKSVLYICPNGYIGGAESFVFNICEAHLTHKNIKPHILFFNDGPGVLLAQKLGITNTVLDQPFKLSSISFFKATIEIRKIIKSLSPDIIHFTMPYSVVACFFALINIKVKKVWFQHGPVGGKLDLIASFLPIDSILFNSRDTMDRHLSHCRNLYHAKLEVINLGVKPQRIIEDQTTLIFKEDKKTILSVGRICELKGIHLLIQAMSILKEQNPSIDQSVQCLIIGNANSPKDKDYQSRLIDIINELNLETVIKFIPYQENIQSFFKNSDILVQASIEAEAFGLVVAEAMMEKLIVVGSRLGGIQDILINNQTGYTFNSTDLNANKDLAKILNLLLSNKVEKKRLIDNAYELISNNYTLEKMTSQIENLYSNIIVS